MGDRVLEVSEPHPWALAAYWCSLNVQGSALLTVVLPRALSRLAAADRTAQLARLSALAAAVAMVVPPAVGLLSDRLRHAPRPVGRRPVVLLGTALNVAGLGWAMAAGSLPSLAGGLLLAVGGQSAALAAYQAMMPEVVDPRRWGEASGYMGVASLLGSLLGLATAGAGSLGTAWTAMLVSAVGGAAVTAVAVAEPRTVLPDRRPRGLVRDWRRFRWIFAARCLVIFGQTLLMTFVLYFFEDVLHVAGAAAGTALVAGLALVGAAGAAFYVGRASDRRDRTRLVAQACVPMAVAVAGFALWPAPGAIFTLAVVWGLGYGAFLSVDWALALDAIPDLTNVARDLGVWGIASNLPAVLAPLAGGWLLQAYAPAARAYRLLFLTAAASFALGGLLVAGSRSPAALRQPLRWLLQLVVAAILTTYVGLVYDVRVLGRLPRDRAGLLVVANHQHDLEGMVVPTRLFLSAPWRGRVRSAGSVRMFEPGFLAGRAPRWLGRLLGPLGLGPVLRALGVLPVENMPLLRPLASWAWEVYRLHGDLPAAEVLTAAALARLGPPPPRRLSDLWARGRLPHQGPLVSILALRAPYREELRRSLRDRLARQLEALAAVLAAGETLYLTPEGRMSATGEAGRFRAALGRVLPHARSVWLAATAYDPWQGRRLAMFTRLVAPADPADLHRSVLVARPVTLSQLVAASLLGHPEGLGEEALAAAVAAARAAAVAAGACVVAPPVDRRALRSTLRRMAARGVAEETGGRWRPGAARCDARFPHVPDLLAAQARQYAETLAACRALRAGAADGRPLRR